MFLKSSCEKRIPLPGLMGKISISPTKRKLQKKLAKHNAVIEESTQSIANNPKRFWSIFRAKIGSPTIPPVVEHNEKAYSTREEKANVFNEFFCSVFNQSKRDDDTADRYL